MGKESSACAKIIETPNAEWIDEMPLVESFRVWINRTSPSLFADYCCRHTIEYSSRGDPVEVRWLYCCLSHLRDSLRSTPYYFYLRCPNNDSYFAYFPCRIKDWRPVNLSINNNSNWYHHHPALKNPLLSHRHSLTSTENCVSDRVTYNFLYSEYYRCSQQPGMTLWDWY